MAASNEWMGWMNDSVPRTRSQLLLNLESDDADGDLGSTLNSFWCRIFFYLGASNYVSTLTLCNRQMSLSILYRVTIQLVQNLRLTAKQKFRYGLGLAWPGQTKAELLF